VEISEHVRDLAGELKGTSVARALVSVRNLHAFAHEEGVTAGNPAAETQVPKLGKRLPKALSVAEIDALLASPDRDDPIGMRDAVLLEMLYGTGARVSEITDLDVDDVTTVVDDETTGLRLRGKGGKERVVPLGSFAREALGAYLVRGRPILAAQGRRGRCTAVEHPWQASDTQLGVHRRRTPCRAGRYRGGCLTSLATAQLCHPSVGGRRRREGSPGAARACLGGDHTDLHPRDGGSPA